MCVIKNELDYFFIKNQQKLSFDFVSKRSDLDQNLETIIPDRDLSWKKIAGSGSTFP
jgi:hypothetical protein